MGCPGAAWEGGQGTERPPQPLGFLWPSTSTLLTMGHWVHVPTADSTMVAPGAKKGQRWGTEQKQKPSKDARAGGEGGACWPGRVQEGPKFRLCYPTTQNQNERTKSR